MRLFSLISLSILIGNCANSNAYCGKPPVTIAVIDSGFGYKDLGHDAKLCKYGHKDFTIDRQFTKNYATKDTIPLDIDGHGTNIVGVIDSYAKSTNTNYCIVVIKYFSALQTGRQNLIATIRAINYAANIKADYINYSGGGPEFDEYEYTAVHRYLKHGKFIAAAGNEASNIDFMENAYYPASYDPRIVVVGNRTTDDCKEKDNCKAPSSNFGIKVTRWEVGMNVDAYGIKMSGTSQATAVATGKIVSENPNKCDIGF